MKVSLESHGINTIKKKEDAALKTVSKRFIMFPYSLATLLPIGHDTV